VIVNLERIRRPYLAGQRDGGPTAPIELAGAARRGRRLPEVLERWAPRR
jgi:hypothetical protein